MKTQVLFQILLSVCLFVSTNCYGQSKYKLDDLRVEKNGYDLKGTLLVDQYYDKQTKTLILEMNNKYKYDIILFQGLSFYLFLNQYYQKDNFTIPVRITGLEEKKKVIKPGSSHVLTFDCNKRRKAYEQIAFFGSFTYMIVNEKEEVIAVGHCVLEEERFEL